MTRSDASSPKLLQLLRRAVHPNELGVQEITRFLSALAESGRLSASSQTQALSALLFLYRAVLHRDLGQLGEIARAKQPIRLPVVLTRDEVRALLARLSDVPRVAVLPDSVAPVLRAHLASVREQHARDLAARAGRVMLPFAYDRKSPHAAKERGWQFVFPAGRR